MLGLMQDQPLLISSIIRHAARHHGGTEVVSRSESGALSRITYRALETRCRRLARALQALGIAPAERVGTLAWCTSRHLELYYAVAGMGSVLHTINPRLSEDDIAFIVNDAGDRVLFADLSFVKLLAGLAPRVANSVFAVVMMTDREHMPDLALPAGMRLLCYEDLIEAADDEFAWPALDERTAASLCYTSGTTGQPKGVLYHHRSTVLHAYAINTADVFGMRAVDRVMPVVPMFHVNAWGIPYAAPMAGAALVMPGRHLDGGSIAELMNAERVTVSAGVPTIWMNLLQHLRTSGTRLHTVKRLIIGGSACPRLLLEAFEAEYGIRVDHAWGMTETSPLGTYNAPKPANAEQPGDARMRLREKQGRAIFGIDMEIVDDSGRALPWDGATPGNLVVRGPWVTGGYFGEAPGSVADGSGWFQTGDVATIDGEGYVELTDRTKDVIKSGGEWISSIQLENIAVSHPDVAEAAIIAAAHPTWGERPLLLVVAKHGRPIDTQALLQIYDGRVAKWCRPDDVVTVAELPHTATGKISKIRLRERYRNYLLERQTSVAETA
ncbi:MAG: long-chain-fatty-acid--CoA ligase [Acidisphaera sp.]|nr:long-chain-fatty-acid--CoA ligase [Acidisphaera sp.]